METDKIGHLNGKPVRGVMTAADPGLLEIKNYWRSSSSMYIDLKLLPCLGGVQKGCATQ